MHTPMSPLPQPPEDAPCPFATLCACMVRARHMRSTHLDECLRAETILLPVVTVL